MWLIFVVDVFVESFVDVFVDVFVFFGMVLGFSFFEFDVVRIMVLSVGVVFMGFVVLFFYWK